MDRAGGRAGPAGGWAGGVGGGGGGRADKRARPIAINWRGLPGILAKSCWGPLVSCVLGYAWDGEEAYPQDHKQVVVHMLVACVRLRSCLDMHRAPADGSLVAWRPPAKDRDCWGSSLLG